MRIEFFKRALAAIAVFAAISITATSPFSRAQSAGEVDYDKKIAELEEKAKKIERDNEIREGKIESLKNDVSQQENYIKEVNTQIYQVNAQIEAYDELIGAKAEQIENTRRMIENKEYQIALKEREVADRELRITLLDAENKENLVKFGRIIKRMYMGSETDAITVLTGSADFYDLLVRAEMIKNTGLKNEEFMDALLLSIERQENAIAELEAEQEELNGQIEECEYEKIKFEREKEVLQAEMDVKSAELNLRYDKLRELSNDKQKVENEIKGLRQEINATNEQVEEINAAVAELIREKQRAANRTNYSSEGFIWPLDDQFRMITCSFGYDPWRGGNHYGVDIGNSGIRGANIYAMQSGTVIRAFNNGLWNGGYGNYVIIDHGGGVSTLYAHCSSTVVSEGQEVVQGDVVGYVGSTGWSTGPHLHFEVRVEGKAVNPMQYFS
ncbi:MAG: peptidoglycan DD-metalloendopeptidase family protein [Oscillospiraceae bacterium]|jgi:murein DD-endopeptidase MepM/ murein hydrolase activator NlpD|nr:peptidoglycan DD-metalloendopeptidase family protein [Oscillospiraceae bacterium]